jgi:hypothetical protein
MSAKIEDSINYGTAYMQGGEPGCIDSISYEDTHESELVHDTFEMDKNQSYINGIKIRGTKMNVLTGNAIHVCMLASY